MAPEDAYDETTLGLEGDEFLGEDFTPGETPEAAARRRFFQEGYLGSKKPVARLSPAATLTGDYLHSLQVAYMSGQPEGGGALAQLRRARGKQLGAPGSAWAQVSELLAPLGAPKSEEPTPTEVAVHEALTLFATLQASERTYGLHQEGRAFASVVGAKVRAEGGVDSIGGANITTRFRNLLSSGTPKRFLYTLGSFAQLVDSPLDFARLVDDLILLQEPKTRKQMTRQWARDFYFAAQAPTK